MKNVFALVYLMTSVLCLNVFAAMPEKFFPVSQGIFRSAQPAPEDFQDLKAFGIKTVLTINSDDQERAAERVAAQSAGIKLIERPMSGFWRPKDEVVNASLADIRDLSNHPILVHCQHGEDRTGLIVGLHRVEAEGMNAAQAYQEMLDRGFHKSLFLLDGYFKERTGLGD